MLLSNSMRLVVEKRVTLLKVTMSSHGEIVVVMACTNRAYGCDGANGGSDEVPPDFSASGADHVAYQHCQLLPSA